MSGWHNTDAVNVTARKAHRCTWCGQTILIGEVYKKWSCFGDGSASTCKMHAECAIALDVYGQQPHGEYEYDQYSFTRGCICESGDTRHGSNSFCINLVNPEMAAI